MQKKWMIYGANGYTSQITVELAKEWGMTPILAGRDQNKVQILAQQWNLPYKVFSLESVDEIIPFLREVDLLLNCAGPFSKTARPLMEACLAAKTHYLDITGEGEVFALAHSLHEQFQQKNLIVCPGVGFDVVPTDEVANVLKREMPQATSLSLAIHSKGHLSPGTVKTILEGLKEGGRIRENGELKIVPFFFKKRNIDFGTGEKLAATVPLADLHSAFYSTGIPHIETYFSVPPQFERWGRLFLPFFSSVLRFPRLLPAFQKYVERKVSGPDLEKRKRGKTWVWGEVSDGAGRKIRAHIQMVDGYELTRWSSLLTVRQLLEDPSPAAATTFGYRTPFQLMGEGFLQKIPGCGPLKLEYIP